MPSMQELIDSGEFKSMSPTELSYQITDDECKRAFAVGVVWASHPSRWEDREELELWSERAELDIIFDDGEPVGFSDRCPEVG